MLHALKYSQVCQHFLLKPLNVPINFSSLLLHDLSVSFFSLIHVLHRVGTSCLLLRYLCFYTFECSRKFRILWSCLLSFVGKKKKVWINKFLLNTFYSLLGSVSCFQSLNSRERRKYDLASPCYVAGTVRYFTYSSHAIHIISPKNVLILVLSLFKPHLVK